MDKYEEEPSNPKLESDTHISHCKAISLVHFFTKNLTKNYTMRLVKHLQIDLIL